jgi:hypothetical protein
MQRNLTAISALLLTVGGWFAIPVTRAGSGIDSSCIQWIAKNKPKRIQVVKDGLSATFRFDRGHAPAIFGFDAVGGGQPPLYAVSPVVEYQPVVIDLPSPSCLAQRPPPQIQV